MGKLVVAPCNEMPADRWRQKNMHLVSVLLDLCLDTNDGLTPTLTECLPEDYANMQKFEVLDNGWVQNPMTWFDNGRTRIHAKCLDSQPENRPELTILDCNQVQLMDVRFEKLWIETPLETQLLIDAATRQRSDGRPMNN